MSASVEDRSVQAMLDRQYVRQVKRLADHLRNYADRIEQVGGQFEQRGRPRHVMAAGDVLSEMAAMFGNAPLWTLQAAADDAQREAARSVAEPVSGVAGNPEGSTE
jgi:hypothetical protein